MMRKVTMGRLAFMTEKRS